MAAAQLTHLHFAGKSKLWLGLAVRLLLWSNSSTLKHLELMVVVAVAVVVVAVVMEVGRQQEQQQQQ